MSLQINYYLAKKRPLFRKQKKLVTCTTEKILECDNKFCGLPSTISHFQEKTGAFYLFLFFTVHQLEIGCKKRVVTDFLVFLTDFSVLSLRSRLILCITFLCENFERLKIVKNGKYH